jgi:hypothetical protein
MHDGSTVHPFSPERMQISIRRDERAVSGHSVSTVASDRTQPGCTGTLPQTQYQTGDAAKKKKKQSW